MTPGQWSSLALRVAFIVGVLIYGEMRYRAGKRSASAAHAIVLAEIASKTRDSADKARAAEQSMQRWIAAIDAKHQLELRNAKELNDRTVSALRAGALELRDHWKGPRCPSVPGPTTGPRIADAGAEDRIEGAADLVQAAAECAAQVRGLQAVVKADRAVKP